MVYTTTEEVASHRAITFNVMVLRLMEDNNFFFFFFAYLDDLNLATTQIVIKIIQTFYNLL